jgi:hypothetical protein
MLQHYVLIRYQKGVTEEHIAEFSRRMLELRTRIGGIEFLEIGRDILHDARSWDLILIMYFASVGALRSYQQHPEHQKVMAFNQPFVTDVASVDFNNDENLRRRQVE